MISNIMSAKYSQAVNFTQPQSLANASTHSKSQSATDTVNISNEGKFSLISSILHSSGKNSVSASSINEDLLEATSFVEKKIQFLYRQIGISPSSKMEISVGSDGKILVNGKSPQSEKLAAAINEDDELSNEIRGMSMMTSAMEAIKKHQEFSAEYEKDPYAAVERYGYLLEDGHEYCVSFSMENGHIDTSVEYI